jgi:hypothetical protein
MIKKYGAEIVIVIKKINLYEIKTFKNRTYIGCATCYRISDQEIYRKKRSEGF